MKFLSIVLALAAFSAASTVPALSRTIHHPTKHARPLYLYYGPSAVGPLYLYRGYSGRSLDYTVQRCRNPYTGIDECIAGR
jgi:hypothetical protein